MPKADIEKRTEFALAYAELGNATQAALRAGVPKSSAHSMGYRWLRDESVVAMIRGAIDDRLKGLGPLAVKVIEEVLRNPATSSQTRLNAARDVLDRLGWVPPRRAEKVDEMALPLEEMSLEQLHAVAAGCHGVRLDKASLEDIAATVPSF